MWTARWGSCSLPPITLETNAHTHTQKHFATYLSPLCVDFTHEQQRAVSSHMIWVSWKCRWCQRKRIGFKCHFFSDASCLTATAELYNRKEQKHCGLSKVKVIPPGWLDPVAGGRTVRTLVVQCAIAESIKTPKTKKGQKVRKGKTNVINKESLQATAHRSHLFPLKMVWSHDDLFNRRWN